MPLPQSLLSVAYWAQPPPLAGISQGLFPSQRLALSKTSAETIPVRIACFKDRVNISKLEDSKAFTEMPPDPRKNSNLAEKRTGNDHWEKTLESRLDGVENEIILRKTEETGRCRVLAPAFTSVECTCSSPGQSHDYDTGGNTVLDQGTPIDY